MIHASYIHEFDFLDEINSEYQENKKYFEDASIELDLVIKQINQKEMFNESTDEIEPYMEKADSIIKRIGDKILEILKKCGEFISKKIDDFRSFLWQRKDKDKLIDKIKEDRPEFAERIRVQVNAEKLNLNDFKDISDFYRSIDKTLDEIEKGDAKSAKGKALKAKEKLEKAANVAVKVGAVVSAASTVVLTFSKVREYVKNRERNSRTIDEIHKCEKELGAHCSSVTRKIGDYTATFDFSSKNKNNRPSGKGRNTNESVDFIVESSVENTPEDIRTRMNALSFVTNIFTSVSKEQVTKHINFMNTMEKAVDQVIRKGGEK